jgi:hypothetical protein
MLRVILFAALAALIWKFALRKPYQGLVSLGWNGGDNLPNVGNPNAVVNDPNPVIVPAVQGYGWNNMANTLTNGGSGGG